MHIMRPEPASGQDHARDEHCILSPVNKYTCLVLPTHIYAHYLTAYIKFVCINIRYLTV